MNGMSLSITLVIMALLFAGLVVIRYHALYPVRREMGDAWFVRIIGWHRIKIRMQFKLHDCFIGACWQTQEWEFHLFLCLLPCLPIHVTIPIGWKVEEPRWPVQAR